MLNDDSPISNKQILKFQNQKQVFKGLQTGFEEQKFTNNSPPLFTTSNDLFSIFNAL